MNRLRRFRDRTAHWLAVVSHRLRAAIRRQPNYQIIITGSDLPSLHFLVDELRRLGPELGLAANPHSAPELLSDTRPVVLSWHPDDLTQSEQIVTDVGRYRRIILVVATADPRDSVCTTDTRLPHQYADGFDYRFRFGPNGSKSLTGPGVLSRLTGLDRWNQAVGVDVVEVSRHQLETNPGEAIHLLSAAVGASSDVGLSLAHIGDAILPMQQIPLWPGTPATRERVVRQIQLAPELETRAVAMGYLPAAEILDETELRPAATVGTVIAFYTPDEVYRAEAQRLRSTLDRLGLAHRFFEVKPEKNWVRTTLLKPIWMSEAREELVGPLLYIDVDAFVHQDPWPYLSQYSSDLAAVYNDGILNSATIWINDTTGARELLKRWVEYSNIRRDDDTGQLQQTGEDSDQTVLRDIVDTAEANGDPTVRFERLPSNMAHIFDQQTTGWVVGPVIIEQLQASRESTQHAKRLERRRQRLRELDAQRNDQSAEAENPGSSL